MTAVAVVRAAADLAVLPAADTPPGEPRRLEVRLVQWGLEAEVSDGERAYTEVWQPGSILAPADGQIAAVYAGHTPTPQGIRRGPLIGRIESITEADDGLYATLVLANTPAASDTWELARTVGATVSIEADVDDSSRRPGQRAVRTAANPAALTGVAVLTLPDRGALPGATVLAARALPDPGGIMTITDTTTAPDPAPAPAATVAPATAPVGAAPPAPAAPGVGQGQLEGIARADVDEMIRQQLVRIRLPQGATPAHPLAQFRTLADFAQAAYGSGSSWQYALEGGDHRPVGSMIARVFVNQITTDNPGVVPPGWVNEVFGIVDAGRPVITGIGSRPLPPEGMSVNWPYFDGDLSALVGEQTTEKTDIVSVKVSLLPGTAPIKTYAGGSDLSYQLIRRSSPSYRDAYLRIMNAAYALVTDKAASLALAAAATGSVELDVAADVEAFRAAVFAASVEVEAATGSPATVILAATDMFIKYGSALLPAAYGTSNVSGTADASTLNVDVSGLRMVHARYLAAGTVIVTNGQAASWAEDGPFVISAPDVSKLGEDTAVWGMGALEVTAPAGVVKLEDTVAATAGRRAAKS